jgi:hypothetical protein
MSVVAFSRILAFFLMMRRFSTTRVTVLIFCLRIVLRLMALAMFFLLQKVLESSITLIVQAMFHLLWKTPEAS